MADIEQQAAAKKKTEQKTRKQLSDKKFCYINSAFRVWGAITLVVLWALTIMTIQKPSYKKHVITWYLLVTSILMSIFELLWVFDQSSCFKEKGCCYCRCWKFFMMFQNWKKGVLYIALAIPTFWIERDYIQSIVIGIMLTACGVCYILMSLLPLFYREKKAATPEQMILNPSPRVKMVSQEMATQTDSYYSYQHAPAQPPVYTEKIDTVALTP